MKKKFMLILLLCLIIICFVVCIPAKQAIKIEDLKNIEYILVEKVATTSSNWSIIGDNNGYYSQPVDVILNGCYPNINYNLQNGQNTYVCYGDYIDDITTIAGYENKVFKVDSWDILYPIQHNSNFPLLSKKYLYLMEFSK